MYIRIAALCVLALASSLNQAAENRWQDVQQHIQSALIEGDAAALAELREALSTWTNDQPGWTHYWQAYLSFRLINLERDEDAREAHMLACKASAETAIESGEQSGESHALLASCLGRLAAGGMMAGMRYGTDSSNMLDESIFIAPDNPRVLMLAAVSDYNKPVIWGGDIDRAERRLREAVEGIEMNPINDAEPWRPAWGQVDVYGHLAIVLDRLEQGEAALAVLDQAAERGLQSGWLDGIRARIEVEN
ncbi:MAG: hypothetical protein AAGH65_01115 [Pseudomonadota bacterium]